MAIPKEEVLALASAFQQAVDLGEAGSISAGFALLLRASRRAHQAVLRGYLWGGELAAGYRRAQDRYCERFPVPDSAAEPKKEPDPGEAGVP